MGLSRCSTGFSGQIRAELNSSCGYICVSEGKKSHKNRLNLHEVCITV